MARAHGANDGETRNKILDAAEHLFANRGYRGASVKEIATRAGVTGAMINYYFGGKLNLYHAVLDRMVEDIGRMVQDVLATGRPPAERLEILFSWFFDYAAEHPAFSKLTKMGLGGSEKGHFEEIIHRFFKPMFNIGVNFLENKLPHKKGKNFDARHLLLTIYVMTTSYFTDAEFIGQVLGKNPHSKKELEKRKELSLDLIFRTVGIKRPDLDKKAKKSPAK